MKIFRASRAAKLRGLPLTASEIAAHETVSVRFHTSRSFIGRKMEFETLCYRQDTHARRAEYLAKHPPQPVLPPPRYSNPNKQTRIGVARGNHAPFAAPSLESLEAGHVTDEIAAVGSWSYGQGRKHGAHTGRNLANAMDASDLAAIMAKVPQCLAPAPANAAELTNATLREMAAERELILSIAARLPSMAIAKPLPLVPHGVVARAEARGDAADWAARKDAARVADRAKLAALRAKMFA